MVDTHMCSIYGDGYSKYVLQWLQRVVNITDTDAAHIKSIIANGYARDCFQLECAQTVTSMRTSCATALECTHQVDCTQRTRTTYATVVGYICSQS
jgi:hypothetical protein